jgi:hypothetical protein
VFKPRQTLIYYPFTRALNPTVERFFLDFHLQVFLSSLKPNQKISSFSYQSFSKLYFSDKKKSIFSISSLEINIPFYSFNTLIKFYLLLLNIFFRVINIFLSVIFLNLRFRIFLFKNYSAVHFYRFFFKIYLNFVLNHSNVEKNSIFSKLYQDFI